MDAVLAKLHEAVLDAFLLQVVQEEGADLNALVPGGGGDGVIHPHKEVPITVAQAGALSGAALALHVGVAAEDMINSLGG